ncbi:MAG: glycoside hydrolase family 2 TIM barrel-domain containing protein [Paludibacter sp.]|nr:glycoside hydrolase family 2 TIM barrel-domain containing protein [Paludibacter sp.]
MKYLKFVLIFTLFGSPISSIFAQKSTLTTERIYLSGHGCDDMVQWDFFCTEGMNSGKWTKIGVPSCWELQGFGQYQYGMKFYGKATAEGIANETGMYKYEFEVPTAWRGKQINIVFEASMTDTQVKINGQKAGQMHQGAFYRFSYNITDRVKYGKKNLLEVTVNKESADPNVNLAERRADYWNFGGIFRPVFLEVMPVINIQQFSIDAHADGTFKANCQLNKAIEKASIKTVILDAKGKQVAESVTSVKEGSDWATAELSVKNPLLWTAETPNRYTAQVSLLDANGTVLHQVSDKFGFRTIEVRPSDGLYINGVKVLIKGVNRHSFRPESGRTLSKAKNIEDVLLIKSMNMNSVRLSHYPADPDFLDACDSLGLYVMDELGGWHGHYDTPTGIKLVKEMVERDVNHPCVIWWSNGNEGGWNNELNGEFWKYDVQHRPVIHPQGNFGGFETMHYRSYGETEDYLRKPEIFMPTEFLHGLYDGGLGAGLYDYWEMMRKHPRCAGGFLWALIDEGVKRVDMNGFIDNQGNWACDGIVGPHHEKEGSYFTIKQVWCPVQVVEKSIDATFNGVFNIENRYDFLNINTCRFVWKQVKFPSASDEKGTVKVLKQGEVNGSDIVAHSAGKLNLNTTIDPQADALFLTAIDYRGEELWRWSFRIPAQKPAQSSTIEGPVPTQESTSESLIITAANEKITFSKKDGELKGVSIGGREISFANGPHFFAARRADRSLDQFYNHDDPDAKAKERTYTEFTDAAVFTGFDIKENGKNLIVTANYKLGNMDKAQWTIAPNGTMTLDYSYNFSAVVDMMGIKFDYPEDKVQSKRWLGDGPYRVWQNRTQGPVYDLWENKYNDPIPGESFDYPEFKGYFAHVSWMTLKTSEGEISITNETPDTYVGVYQPRDGRDNLLYKLPESGISILNVIPPVRNKVNSTDLNGPSAQPKWVDGEQTGRIVLKFK